MNLVQFKRSFGQIIAAAKQKRSMTTTSPYLPGVRDNPAALYAEYSFLFWVSDINIDSIQDKEICCELFSEVQQYLWDRKSDWCIESSFQNQLAFSRSMTTLDYRSNYREKLLESCVTFYIEIAPTITAEYNQYLRWDLETSVGTASAPFQLKKMPMKVDMNYAKLLLAHSEHIENLLKDFPLLEPEEYRELNAYLKDPKDFFSEENLESAAMASLLVKPQNQLCPQLTIQDAGKNHLFAEYGRIEQPAPLLTIYSTETGRGYYSLCRQALQNNEFSPTLKFIHTLYSFYRLSRFSRRSYMRHENPNLAEFYKRFNSRISMMIRKNEMLYIDIILKLYDIETLLMHITNQRNIFQEEAPENFSPVFERYFGKHTLAQKVLPCLSTDNYIAECQGLNHLETHDKDYRCLKRSGFVFYKPLRGTAKLKYSAIKARISISPDAIISQQVFDRLYPTFLNFTDENQLIYEFKITDLYYAKTTIRKLEHNLDLKSIRILASVKRVFYGGQFTVYFHNDFQIHHVVEFARQVEQILASGGILPGLIPESDVALGRYVSMTIQSETGDYVSAEKRNPADFMHNAQFAAIVKGMSVVT